MTRGILVNDEHFPEHFPIIQAISGRDSAWLENARALLSRRRADEVSTLAGRVLLSRPRSIVRATDLATPVVNPVGPPRPTRRFRRCLAVSTRRRGRNSPAANAAISRSTGQRRGRNRKLLD